MECELHLPSVLTPPKGSYSSRILSGRAATAGLLTHVESHLCFCGPASFFKGPLDQGWAGHTGIKDATQRKVSCSPEHCHMLRLPPLERILARNKLPLHPHFSAPPSLGCKQERPFSPLWALLDPPALHWVSFPVYFIHLKARSKPSARLRDLSPTCILGVIAREGVLVHARMLSSTPTPSTLCHIIPP